MLSFFRKILNILVDMCGRLFEDDMDVISLEARRILANPEDRKKYIDAIWRIKDQKSERETIILSNGEVITMM